MVDDSWFGWLHGRGKTCLQYWISPEWSISASFGQWRGLKPHVLATNSPSILIVRLANLSTGFLFSGLWIWWAKIHTQLNGHLATLAKPIQGLYFLKIFSFKAFEPQKNTTKIRASGRTWSSWSSRPPKPWVSCFHPSTCGQQRGSGSKNYVNAKTTLDVIEVEWRRLVCLPNLS